MSSLKYVGKAASAARHVVNRFGVDQNLTEGVTTSVLQARVGDAVAPLAWKDQVDAGDLNLVDKAYVDQRDSLLMTNGELGTSNGVATTIGGQIPYAQLFRTPVWKEKMPSKLVMQSNVEQAYYDSSGQWDKFVGSITIPAPGAGYGLWRPMVFARFECYTISDSGRADIRAMIGSYEIGRGCGINKSSTSDSQPYSVTVLPRHDVDNQKPGGWGDTSSLTVNFFLSATFLNTRVALAGANTGIAFAQRV